VERFNLICSIYTHACFGIYLIMTPMHVYLGTISRSSSLSLLDSTLLLLLTLRIEIIKLLYFVFVVKFIDLKLLNQK